MPPQTRAARGNPPAGRVYESPRLPPQQVKFQPRRQKVYGRHSLDGAKRKKQETLTQIGFVNPLTDKEIDEEIEAYEREEKTRNKRRKTLTPSSKFYTQTLTQLDFDSTPKVECRDTEDEDEDGDDVEDEDEEEQNQEQKQADTEVDERTEHVSESPVPPRRRSKRGGIITVRCIKVEPEASPSPSPSPQNPTIPPHEPASSQTTTTKPSPSQATTSMPPPKTPTRKRTLEVPSSLSPATPLSSQSIAHSLRTHDQRSPLKPRSGNLNRLTSPIPSSPSKLSLPHQSQISTQAITQDSPLSRVPDSSPFRPRHVTQSTQSPSAQVLSEFTAASTPTPPPPRRVAKTEIADSDADSDADLDEDDEDDEDDDDEDDGLAPLPLRAQPPVQVPSSPDTAPRRRWAVTSSSPPRRPVLAVKETVLGSEGDDLGSQWTRSQLLPGSLGMDSLLALPPGFGEGEEWDE